jgi:addiction module HigA family antidote
MFEPTTIPHPGDTISEYLDVRGWSQRELARRTGLTPKTISEICAGKAPITPATALALEKVLQRPAHLWLNLQRAFDEADARSRARQQHGSWNDWLAKFPVKKMKDYGWLTPHHGESDIDALLTFFAVSSPNSWDSVWKSLNVSYRQTRTSQHRPEDIAVWLRVTEMLASQLSLAAFDEARLRAAIPALRSCTMKKVSDALGPLQSLCAATGLAVVWERELPHTGISGCARWLPSGTPLIALTLRYKTDDQLWFTFFHELAHILHHRKVSAFILDNPAETLSDRVVDPEMQKVEDEANRFSADTMIPPESFAPFIRAKTFTNESIYNFSKEVGIAPGIVVGRLQFEQLLKAWQGNTFKQKLSWGKVEDEK